ncbi:MAG: EAL domain-containing protein [Proteobacteria bacterium]|nr:EAL domain-containing protein [Pseudomonadota bacterium]
MSRRRSQRVLLADDDAMLREIATGMLEQAGFEVATAASGDGALAACAARMPDIVLLDVQMSDGDGYQACANIRALPGATVPIVMITGLEDPQSIDRAYQAGATDFMVKPINWPLLVRRIEYVLNGARTLDALRHSEENNAALLKLMPDGLFLVDRQGLITQRFSANRGLIRRRAAGAAEAIRLVDFLPSGLHATAMERLASAVRGVAAAFEFSLGGKRRGVRHFECRLLPKSSGEVLVVLRDVTRRKDSEGRMRRLAYIDALTGLPNREWIKSYLAKALARAERHKTACAVLFVDLDGFKRVNDTLGHETGDALLAQVAGRLRSALGYCRRRRPEDPLADNAAPQVGAQLARLGGDEFIAVLTGAVTPQAAERAAGSIRDELNSKFVLAGYEVSVTPSIGIALSPQHGREAAALLKNADEAMYLAKSSGRNQYRFYDDTLRARALLRSALELDLRAALGTEQLQVLYQPQYDARSLQIVGAETLLRWVHPERGEIASADLMAIAEDTGFICELDAWLLAQACADLKTWRSRGVSVGRLSLKISGREFLRPEMPIQLSRTIEQAGVEPSLFELQLTEAVLMRDASTVRRTLQALKELGFLLAIDDFGSGECSFNSLKQLPLDTLKIAASFIEEIPEDTGNLAIVRAIIALGRKLSMRVVAKGVHTVAQLQFLREESCDLVQGFLLSPPVAADRFVMLAQSSGPTTQTVRALQLASSPTEDLAEVVGKAWAGGNRTG